MKFQSEPLPEDDNVAHADKGAYESIVSSWDERNSALVTGETDRENKCYVISISQHEDERVRRAQLQEIVNLVEAQGDSIVGSELCSLRRPNPRTLLGKGKAREIAAMKILEEGFAVAPTYWEQNLLLGIYDRHEDYEVERRILGEFPRKLIAN